MVPTIATITINYELTEEFIKQYFEECGGIIGKKQKFGISGDQLTKEERSLILQLLDADERLFRSSLAFYLTSQVSELINKDNFMRFLESEKAAMKDEAYKQFNKSKKDLAKIAEDPEECRSLFVVRNAIAECDSILRSHGHRLLPNDKQLLEGLLQSARDVAEKAEKEDEERKQNELKAKAEDSRKLEEIKAKWIEAHGSPDLKMGLQAGYPMVDKLADELLAWLVPGATNLADEDGTYDISKLDSPTPEEIKAAQDISKRIADLGLTAKVQVSEISIRGYGSNVDYRSITIEDLDLVGDAFLELAE